MSEEEMSFLKETGFEKKKKRKKWYQNNALYIWITIQKKKKTLIEI